MHNLECPAAREPVPLRCCLCILGCTFRPDSAGIPNGTRVPVLWKTGTSSVFDRKAYITTYEVRKTRSVLDRNLICFIITPPRNNSTHLLLLGHPFHPPPRALVDFGVVEVGDQAVRSNLSARLQTMIGGPAQDLSNFQTTPIPILSVLTCSTS
jgi:hypothetical protein